MAKQYDIHVSNPEDSAEKIAEKLNTLVYAIDSSVVKDVITRNEFNQFTSKTNKFIETAPERTRTNEERRKQSDLRYHGSGGGIVVGNIVSTPTPTPLTIYTQFDITALSVAATFAIPQGNLTHGQKMIIRIKDNGGAQNLSWNAIYRAVGVTLPTITTASKNTYVGMIYNGIDNKWDVVATAQE